MTVFILTPVTNMSTLIFTMVIGTPVASPRAAHHGSGDRDVRDALHGHTYGFVFVSHQVGSFLGVWLGGRLYDQFGFI